MLCIAAVASPMLLTQRAFGPDWTNHLWLVWNQGRTIGDVWHPGYFLNNDTLGVFYPHFAFYGGTLYAIVGGGSAVLGDRAAMAYVGASTAAIAIAYGGWLWLARQAGLAGWRAQVPAIVYITSAYYVTNLYGRGAWPEFVATSALPLVAAAGIWLLRTPRWSILPAFAFVVSIVVWSGSHNISLVWGSMMLAALIVILVVASTPAGREIPWRRAAAVLGIAALSVGVNSWFLLPDVVNAHRTLFSAEPDLIKTTSAPFDQLSVLFNPLRKVPTDSSTPGLFVQLPVLPLAWAVVALGWSWRMGLGRFWRRLAIGLGAIGAVITLLILWNAPWEYFPGFLRRTQFPYRLNAYVTLCIAGLVLVGLVGLKGQVQEHVRRGVRAMSACLGVIALFSVGIAVWQAWSPKSDPDQLAPAVRDDAFASQFEQPPGWYDAGFYRDRSQPIVSVDPERKLVVPPASVEGDRFEGELPLPGGPRPIVTNIAAGPYLAEVSGVRSIGRTTNGFLVVQREQAGSRPVVVSIRTARPAAVAIGIAASLVSLACLLVLLLRYVIRRRIHSPRVSSG